MRRGLTPMGYPGSKWRLVPNGQARMSDGGNVHGGFPFPMYIRFSRFCNGMLLPRWE